MKVKRQPPSRIGLDPEERTVESVNSAREQQREYLQRWKRLGPVLDGIRFQELRAMSDESRVQATAALLACSTRRIPNDAAGWVAWQKVRERWMRQH